MTAIRSSETSVADYVAKRINELAKRGKTARQIAEEVGYKSSNMISMLKSGRAKVPLEKIPSLARSLDIDTGLLLRLVLSEYSPDLHRTIVEIFGAITTANERDLINSIRKGSKYSDPRVTEDKKRQLREFFENQSKAIENSASCDPGK